MSKGLVTYAQWPYYRKYLEIIQAYVYQWIPYDQEIY